MSKKEFLQTWGQTPKAYQLVLKYFDKRKNATAFLLFGGLALVAGIALAIVGAGAGGYGVIIALLGGFAIIAGFVLSLIGLLFFHKYSRKKLLQKLRHPENIPELKSVPKRSIQKERHTPNAAL